MTIPSRGTEAFWRLYHALPAEVRGTARKNYRLWQANAFHPSLHFKSIGQPNWSARVGDHYRAIGRFIGDEFVWEWIGSHADYDKRFRYPASGKRAGRGLVADIGINRFIPVIFRA